MFKCHLTATSLWLPCSCKSSLCFPISQQLCYQLSNTGAITTHRPVQQVSRGGVCKRELVLVQEGPIAVDTLEVESHPSVVCSEGIPLFYLVLVSSPEPVMAPLPCATSLGHQVSGPKQYIKVEWSLTSHIGAGVKLGVSSTSGIHSTFSSRYIVEEKHTCLWI